MFHSLLSHLKVGFSPTAGSAHAPSPRPLTAQHGSVSHLTAQQQQQHRSRTDASRTPLSLSLFPSNQPLPSPLSSMAPPPPGPPTLHDLARSGDVPALAAALAAGADVGARDHYSRTPLVLAAHGGHAGAVAALLAAGAAPTTAAKGDQSALHFAAMRGATDGHVEVAKALIDAGKRGKERMRERVETVQGRGGEFSSPPARL